MRKKINLYFINVLTTMLIIPALFIVADVSRHKAPLDVGLAGKYFIGWAIGARLLIAGFRQALRPELTAEQIFNIRDSIECLPFIRELGFANICMGAMAMISLFHEEWRLAAAVTGGLYFGLAGFLHLFRKTAGFNEQVAKISDLFIFGLALLYTIFTLSQTGSPTR
jgi:hypothetical protein